MIKYMEIEGYNNLGEVALGSHVYQWIEKDIDVPKIILVKAYATSATAFKGYLMSLDKTFENVPVKEEELKNIERTVGKITQKSFDEFIKRTVLGEEYKDFTERNK